VRPVGTTPFETPTAQLRQPLTDDDHLLGPPAAAVTLVEYGDYQCPYCRAAYPLVKELLRLRPETVRLVYRHFPLTNVHPYAETAAELAEAAAVRGAFWPMHDWLFTHQDVLDPPHLALGLDRVGLPVEEVDRELDARRYRDRVQRDFVGGIRSGVNGTPTFFVNGVRNDRGYDLPTLLAVVDTAAARSLA
jgi:protein-disulfide isomerase